MTSTIFRHALITPAIIKNSSGRFVSPDGAQDRRAIIVEHEKRHSQKINPHIKCRQPDDVIRCPHQRQRSLGKNKSHQRHDNSTDQCQGYRGMYGLRYLFLTPRRIETRRQYICPQRNSDKQIREHVDERTGRSHRCQRLAAGKPCPPR